MNKLYTAIYTDRETGIVIYRLNQRNPLNKFFWEKEKLVQLEKLSRLRDMPKSQIDINDCGAVWE